MDEFIVKVNSEENPDNAAKTGTDKNNSVGKAYVIEPSLLPESRSILPSFQVSGWLASYPHFLEKRVQRNPRNLLSHVQRTLLHFSMGKADATYGALVDLFLILGPRGPALRENLLGKTKGLLSEDQFHFLSTRIDAGLKTEDVKSSVAGACLAKISSGDLNIVNRTDIDAVDSSDPLTLARECLQQKDPAAAQLILEGALENDPGQEDVCKDLLTLYRENSMSDAFSRTYNSLLGRRLAVAELWRETEQFLQDAKSNG